MNLKQLFVLSLVAVSLSCLAIAEGFKLGYLVKAETVKRAISFEVSE